MLIGNAEPTKCIPPYMIDSRRRGSDARQGRVSGVSGDGACDGQRHDPTLPSPARRHCSANAKHCTSPAIPSHPSLPSPSPPPSAPPPHTPVCRQECFVCWPYRCSGDVMAPLRFRSDGVRECIYRRRGARSPITCAVRGSGDRRQY